MSRAERFGWAWLLAAALVVAIFLRWQDDREQDAEYDRQTDQRAECLADHDYDLASCL